ncbi:MAG: ABC transporter permease, partial [Chloroflexota bacterium]|nr:ABC transporter permease [Chloroflexota bacterium]
RVRDGRRGDAAPLPGEGPAGDVHHRFRPAADLRRLLPDRGLADWMQALARISPVYYALEGIRNTLIDGTGLGHEWRNLWPLLIMGAITVPLGIQIFQLGERYAKRTGRLKRSG